MRRTLKQLAYDLFMASRKVHRDRYYRHQKSGSVYKVVGYFILESTGETHVLFRPAALKPKAPERLGAFERSSAECVFGRPVSEFLEETEWEATNGDPQKGPRFTEVRKVEKFVDVA